MPVLFANPEDRFYPVKALFILAMTFFRPMEFSIKLHTIKSEWFFIHIQLSHVTTSKSIVFCL